MHFSFFRLLLVILGCFSFTGVSAPAEGTMAFKVFNHSRAIIQDLIIYRGGSVATGAGGCTSAIAGNEGTCLQTPEWQKSHWIASMNPVQITSAAVQTNRINFMGFLAFNDPDPGRLNVYRPATGSWGNGSASTPNTNPVFGTYPQGAGGYTSIDGNSPYMSVLFSLTLDNVSYKCVLDFAYSGGGNGTFSIPSGLVGCSDITGRSGLMVAATNFSTISGVNNNVVIVLGCSFSNSFSCTIHSLDTSTWWKAANGLHGDAVRNASDS